MDALTRERLRSDIIDIYIYIYIYMVISETSSKFLDGIKGLHQNKIPIKLIIYIYIYLIYSNY